MKFLITCKHDSHALNLKKRLKDRLIKAGFSEDFYKPDVVFALGGDGTFLRATQEYFSVNPIFIGINMGSLGYLCEFGENDIEIILKELDNPKISNVPLLEAEANSQYYFALNEIRILAKNGCSLKFDVYIDGEFFETVRSDGCAISSSIGSSGYLKSIGGALLEENSNLMQFKEIAPITNRIYYALTNPLILSKEHKITLKNFSMSSFYLYYDGENKEISKFRGDFDIKYSNYFIRIMKNEKLSLVAKIKGAFLK